MYKWWLVLLLFLPKLVESQIITTIAGLGCSAGYVGEGGPATAAGLATTWGGVFDAAGNYYFAQAMNRIRMIDNAGIIHTVVGTSTTGYGGDGGPATAAQLHMQGFTVDAVGNIYIGDFYNYRIRKVDAVTHIITTIAGNGIAAYSGDGGAATAAQVMSAGICLDNLGNIYTIDTGGILVRKINTSGIISTFAGGVIGGFSGDAGPATAARLAMNYGICTDANNLYLACDTRIRNINLSTGVINTIAGTGSFSYIGDGIPATAAQFDAYNIGIDTTNNALYIADVGNDRVYKIDAAGIFHLIAGTGTGAFSGDGGPATAAQLWNPEGVAADKCGNVYIADDANCRIRKILFPSTPTIDSVSITTTTGDAACAGFPITFLAHVHGGHATQYVWIRNGAYVGTTTDSTFTYTPAAGDIMGVRTYDCSGFNVMDAMPIIFAPVTVPTISITGTTSTTIGTNVTVNAAISGAGSSYIIKWFKNSTLFTTTTIPTLTYTKAAGTDTITARVVSTAIGCYDSTLSGPHIITVIPAGVQDIYPGTIGSLIVYPNPAQNILYITITLDLTSPSGRPGGACTVSNLVGQTLLTKEYNTNNLQLDIFTLPTGTYLLKAIDNTGRKMVAKFSKQ